MSEKIVAAHADQRVARLDRGDERGRRRVSRTVVSDLEDIRTSGHPDIRFKVCSGGQHQHDVRIEYRKENAEGFRVFSGAARQSAEWARPDWILLIDSDEFCMSKHGDLRLTAALADADVVQLPRFNVPPVRFPGNSVRNVDLRRPEDA
jgi:hypothetical protein